MTVAELFGGWPPQTLQTAGPAAHPVATLIGVAGAMGVGVTLIVLVALRIATHGKASLKAWVGSETAVLVGGLAFPVAVLSALLVYGLSLTNHLISPAPAEAMRIRIVGEQWWWRVIYLEGGEHLFETANEIVIPAGVPVIFELEAADVIHSVWIPRLSGKLDMIPGRRNILRLQADEPGLYGGQCAEYCGGAHAWMKFSLRAVTPSQFLRWRDSMRVPAAWPEAQTSRRGATLFIERGCGECHSVRGVSGGRAGPDLTHVGARATVGAGMLPMSRASLARWVAQSQDLKPGNRMPSYSELSDEELAALASYLEGLR